jgi:hypothetical protein
MKTAIDKTALLLCLLLSAGMIQATAPEEPSEESKEAAAEVEENDEKEENEKDKDEKKKPKTISEVVEEHTLFEGLFPIYQDPKSGALHLVVNGGHIDQEFIYFTHTVDGVVAANHFRGAFRGNLVFSIRKHFERIEFVAENTSFHFDEQSALHRAAGANISPGLLAVEKIVAQEDGQFLIKADDLFITEALHQVKPTPRSGARSGDSFSLGKLSKGKSKVVQVRNYPMNTDVVVEYVYENEAPQVRGGEEVTDPRNVSIRMQHSLIRMPENNYQPRFDDPRVGYFTTRVTDLTSPSATPYRDLVHRWHLEKKDKNAPLSEPVEPIVWWIENTTPVEYREIIREAALAWNDAFEAAGFKDAIVVKAQPDDADWDAGDIRYNVLRWTSSPNPPFGGYGPSFVNPRTGQILGANIMLEFVFLTHRLQLERLFSTAALSLDELEEEEDLAHCSLGHHLHLGALFGLHTLKAAGAGEAEKRELTKHALYYLILHELGHTFGLNHNMRSSQLHCPSEIHNRELTSQVGLTGSVMDYPAINLALPGEPQGLYYTTKPGPYDFWAIEFGYSEALDDPDEERSRLRNLLERSTDPALAFGNDADDMRSPGKAIDPRVMIGDMSSDAISYAIGRFQLVRQVMEQVKDKYSIEGESWHDLRNAYLLLTGQYGASAAVISRYIGGVYVDRAKAGQPGGNQPFTPVSLEDQRRAMEALRTFVFAPDAFQAPDGLYSYLQMQRRGFDFFSEPEDPKIHERTLNIQRNILNHLLHPRVLKRLSDSRLYGNEYTLPMFMIDLTQAVFGEDAQTNVNTFRQNLQIEYVNRLARMINSDSRSQFDHLSQSMALHSLRNVRKLLAARNPGNTETQAHTAHVLHLIDRALDN